jgi:hypothetical protein
LTEKPIPLKDLPKHLEERDAQAPPPDVAVTNTMFVVGRKPVPEVRSVKRVNGDEKLFRVDLEVPGVAIGVHAIPPGVEGTKLAPRRKLFLEDDHADKLVGFLPDHLPLRIRPAKLDRRFVTGKKIDALALRDPKQRWATTVFAPDNRYTFNDTSFPWCTAGRVETSSGGTLVDWWGAGGTVPALVVIPEFLWEAFLGIYCAIWGFRRDSPILSPAARQPEAMAAAT